MISRPKPHTVPQAVRERSVTLFFDGGCRRKEGAGGYLAFWRGVCLGGRGVWLGAAAPTNNVAEAEAMLAGLCWLEGEHPDVMRLASDLVVCGDS